MLNIPSIFPRHCVPANHSKGGHYHPLCRSIPAVLLILALFHINGVQAKGAELSTVATDSSSSEQGLISINSAPLDELMRLPGIGRTRAHAIIHERNQHGPFIDPADLERVKGIGSVTAEKLKNKISFHR